MQYQRIATLDYLRGLMALFIMVYHYFSWTYKAPLSESILGVLGIYGVSIFYILSGLTLYLVYFDKLILSTSFSFYIKRIFRIYPVLWLAILLNIFLLNKTYDIETIFLNVTGIFGFVAHDNYIPTGAWSIGNELVFYSLFPFIIIGKNIYKYFLEVCFTISLLIGGFFCFIKMTDLETLQTQWKIYINPFNQLFLFLGGMLVAKYFSFKKIRL
ncbi:acyltransferase family protein [Flagellimonas sp. 2504JD1-5]